MVMLVAAAVTDRLVKSSVPVMQFGQSSSQNILSAEKLEVYRSYISPDINRAYTSQPEIETTTNDALSAPDIWTRIRSGFVFPEVDPDLLQTYIDEYRKHPLLLKQILQRGEPYLFHIVDRL
jgi:hypothetical protein